MALLHYLPPLSPYLNIIYQDNDFLILNKPAGLLTVPGKQLAHRDSLEIRVKQVFPTARIVHRLDMATSGLLVMALSLSAQRILNQQFAERIVDKTYQAEVFGRVEPMSGEVNLPLICDWPNRPKQKICFEKGKSAQTYWQVLEKYDNSTVVKLKPITGRSHQLRVHMQSLQHPILGDRLYAHPQALQAATRLKLHACELNFIHPTNGEKQHFVSECPF